MAMVVAYGQVAPTKQVTAALAFLLFLQRLFHD
jgi:hypothetical protein